MVAVLWSGFVSTSPHASDVVSITELAERLRIAETAVLSHDKALKDAVQELKELKVNLQAKDDQITELTLKVNQVKYLPGYTAVLPPSFHVGTDAIILKKNFYVRSKGGHF